MGSEVVVLEVVGSEVMSSEVMGSEVVDSEVMGSEVVVLEVVVSEVVVLEVVDSEVMGSEVVLVVVKMVRLAEAATAKMEMVDLHFSNTRLLFSRFAPRSAFPSRRVQMIVECFAEFLRQF